MTFYRLGLASPTLISHKYNFANAFDSLRRDTHMLNILPKTIIAIDRIILMSGGKQYEYQRYLMS